MNKPQEKDYEENIQRLENIISTLEQGDLTLEKSLRAFEEGIGLVKICHRQLERFSDRLQILQTDDEEKQKVD